MKPFFKEYETCPRCVMDSTAVAITFFDDGCSYCRAYDREMKSLPKFQVDAQQRLEIEVDKIRQAGKGKKYDCVIGLSGGVDSTYVAWLVKKQFNLRVLAVHLDNGWNDELAVHNIEKIIRALDLDLVTSVLKWREFKSIQLAFLKAGVPDCEVPTDHAIQATLMQVARKYDVPTIIKGSNRETEGIMAHNWSQGHTDWKYIGNIARRYGQEAVRTYPHTTYFEYVRNKFFPSVSMFKILSYVPFNKKEIEAFIEQEMGWEAYGGKHYESVYTKFFQGYWLPHKFGFDKRKGHLSSLICAGQISRTEALEVLKTPPIAQDEVEELFEYVAEKLGVSIEGLREIEQQAPKTFADFPSRYNCWEYHMLRAIHRVTLKPLLKIFGKTIDPV
ncbi:N-acetyl sugar amidotransferase [Candidatus Terasakiella magnetica]|uniref:N-acetyl sugar amidotransferase n=1 Tax=Candidatus Terasakiella magnetica TaxID=1867952 RepID=A0A1C3RFZ5_9PROT|nr:N-acetyl sugar amidotransferase [Candidatus Terasakiella magnetica]SCA56223.1 N-acetyl sugar amidotransferase [Candidatus Terasakiella magnetica]